ncbi:MAG: 2-isopropylmalate synthase [Oscillospiraceae bacterium]|jgi:2-isopropylmalate synthase|nr:2-isopropylmalate synthase [Oscillospiraceae bacterium]
MNEGFRKYRPYPPVSGMENRKWPDRQITKAPVWCSVDLRDGNQALVNPMSLAQKVMFFTELCNMGFKEIEVGFPSSNDTEYETLRTLIDNDLIPDDVWIQVLVQCREHLIRKTFEAVKGAKNVIIHFYGATSELMRNVVFRAEKEQIVEIAAQGAALSKTLAAELPSDMNIRYEYSPEHFSGTEPDFAVEICAAVMEALGATKENPVILNLPSSVQLSTSNIYADLVEYFCDHLPNREAAIISVHPHNDRGSGISDAEFALMAGAERVEGTIFGNGERTGNVDILVLALNMYTQGVDPMLDVSNVNHLKQVYEQVTGMKVHERHPYAGELVFTAFSGSHQDAIKKGFDYMEEHNSEYWYVPYLPISPADVGRQYEPIIRINSQSGKGGAAFIMQTVFGYNLPKKMHPEFGAVVKAAADGKGAELAADEIMEIFKKEYLERSVPYSLKSHKINDLGEGGEYVTNFSGVISHGDKDIPLEGNGNGPIDAFFDALGKAGIDGFRFINYYEHAIGSGSNAKAVSYIELRTKGHHTVFGVGTHNNTSVASILGVLCAVNRAVIVG